jgi:hypothetical protein
MQNSKAKEDYGRINLEIEEIMRKFHQTNKPTNQQKIS